MKLTAKERAALEMMRQLDARQRDTIIAGIRRELLANNITARIGKMRKLKFVTDRRVEGTFGLVPKKPPRRRAKPE